MRSRINSNYSYDISELIVPIERVPKSSPDKNLGSVLAQSDSSHAPVFIFKDEKFLGLVSPHQTLYSGNYPYSTKVSSVLFHPPRITGKTPIHETVGHMLETKLYILPVFGDNGSPTGIIRGKGILQYAAGDPRLLRFMSRSISIRRPITAHVNSSVRDIYRILKENAISRVVLVNDANALAGIITRHDLMDAFIKPTAKRRFAPEGTVMGFYSRAGEKKYRQDQPANRYTTGMVDNLPDSTPIRKVVLRLIESPYNSIVLVDKRFRPSGFLSMHDLLQTIAQLRPEEEIPLIIKKPGGRISKKELETVKTFLTKFGRKLKERMAVEKITVSTEELKNTRGLTREYSTSLVVTPIAGEPLIAKVNDYKFLDSIQSATTLIEKQRRRTGLNKRGTAY
ncbi:MAG TPA: CBS domain-containing protein [Candidatus Saccharimonadales bacterium]|nr:CBS domain-containing protein [Candidatus Saccharimonadales bacterium]